MNVSRMGRRLAVSGIATAIAAAGLVGGSTVAANASSADGTYNCALGQVPLGSFPVHVDAPGLEAFPSLAAGTPVAGGLLTATTTMNVPTALAGQLTSNGVTGGSIHDFAIHIGDAAAPADLALQSITDKLDGTTDIVASGVNKDFAIPAGGKYNILLPKSFTFTPSVAGVDSDQAISCVTEAPASLGSFESIKNPSSTALSAPAKVKKGKAAKLVAKVEGAFDTATGKVVFKDGKKKLGTVTLKGGKAVYKAKGLKPGKHSITAKYSGDGFREASSAKSVVKVVK